MDIDHKNKYPISKNNMQCVGPCYEAGTWIVHPITLDYVRNQDLPFCPVNVYEEIDHVTKKSVSRITDVCYVPTSKKDVSEKELENNIIIPQIPFNCNQFLKLYYDINDKDGIIEYVINHKEDPLQTRLRIMNCYWQEYGYGLKTVDTRIVDFYIQVVKKLWIRQLYPIVSKYINVDNNGNITISSNAKNNKHNKVERINYFIELFVSNNNMYNFLISYSNQPKDRWDNIQNHTVSMLILLKKYIKEQLDNLLK